MRVFVDACIDPRIVEILVGYEAKTAFDLGWQSLKDNVLLPKVAAAFDVLLTADQGFEFEHNVKKLPISIIIIHVRRNKLADYRAVASRMVAAIKVSRPGEVVHVGDKP
jgi:predicted nuclease of predicted toxin-antitoxin system